MPDESQQAQSDQPHDADREDRRGQPSDPARAHPFAPREGYDYRQPDQYSGRDSNRGRDANRDDSVSATFWLGTALIALASALWLLKFLGVGTVDYRFMQLFLVAALLLVAGKAAIQGVIDGFAK